MRRFWLSNHTKRVPLVYAILVSLVLLALPANAEDATQTNTSETPKIDCRKYKLTSNEFMQAIHTIIMHRDLRDIPFIEKALKVKFVMKKGKRLNKPPALYYETFAALNSIVGLSVTLFDDGPDEIPHLRGSAEINLHINEDYFHDCLHISVEQFNGYFAGQDRFDDEKEITAKNGATIKFGYRDDRNDKILTWLYFKQTAIKTEH